MTLGTHITARRVSSALRWLRGHYGAARVARRLRVSPATVRLYCHAEASPYMVRRWMASERGAEWCRAMVRGARRGRVDAAWERRQLQRKEG